MQPNFPQPPLPPGQSNYQVKKSFNKLIIPLFLVFILFIISAGFGYWAYSNMLDYKNNVDKKISVASEQTKQTTISEKDKEFIEKEKNPLKTYKGPETYGGVSVSYPKTWSAYVSELGGGSLPVDGYFHPGFVPSLQSTTAFALRVQISNQPYDSELNQYASKVRIGKLSVSPYRAKKVPGVLGSRVEGEITTGQYDTKILLPLRDKTLEIWTESREFVNDFDNIVMANLTFSP